MIEEVVAGEDDAGVGGEGGEEVEFFGAEGEFFAGDEHTTGVEVEVEVHAATVDWPKQGVNEWPF